MKVRVSGMAETQRSLKKLDPALALAFRKEFLTIGKKIALDAKTEVPRVSGKARGSIRAGMKGQTPYVAGGKASVPYYGWLDFGSRTPRSGRPRSVGPWKGSGGGPKQGRFIYAAIAENRARIQKRAVAAFDKAAKAANLK